MKKYIFLISILTISFINKINGQTPDSTVNSLLAMNESQYINKPLDSIITNLPAGYDQIKILSGGHLYTARKIRIRYPNEVYIELHVRQYTHMNPVDSNRIWDIALMRQENLYKTVIYKNNTCYRNCDVQ